MAVVLRESPHGLTARISFFGAALLFTPLTFAASLPVLALVSLFIDFSKVDSDVTSITYVFSTVSSVFAVPLWKHLFRLAKTMLPTPRLTWPVPTMTFISGTSALLLFFYLIVGSLTGSLAYVLTSRIVSIDSSTLKPLGLLAYLALFATIKMGVERFGSSFSFWIMVGACIAMWLVAIFLRNSSTNFMDRITFFGCGLMMAALLSGLGIIFIACIWSMTNTFPKKADIPVHLGIYIVSTLASVFAAPLLEHLYHFAMSMRPKSN